MEQREEEINKERERDTSLDWLTHKKRGISKIQILHLLVECEA